LGCSIFSETRKYHVFLMFFCYILLLYPILSQYIHVQNVLVFLSITSEACRTRATELHARDPRNTKDGDGGNTKRWD
jgi:hypothetical protein